MSIKSKFEERIIFIIFFIHLASSLPINNSHTHAKFVRDYENFMDAYCVNDDINPEILRKLDDCDEIIFSKEGKEMEKQCLIESSPKGASVNDRRRLWCNDQNFYEKTKQCYSTKLDQKQKSGHIGEQISEEQLKNDTIRAMDCRKRAFKF